jgi:hypothetical protein
MQYQELEDICAWRVRQTGIIVQLERAARRNRAWSRRIH